jgi:hypothetical protein
MSRNSDVAKIELQLQHQGYLVILLSSYKKIPGIQYKSSYSLPTLHIDSIQSGTELTCRWRQQVEHRESLEFALYCKFFDNDLFDR